jgi:hypothetical protein
VDTTFEIPIEFAGAGAWETLVLAATLAEPDTTVLVLDEPAVALHATFQRHLLTHLEGLHAQVIVVTHSPYLLPLQGSGADVSIIRIAPLGSSAHAWTVDTSLCLALAPKLVAKGNERIPFAVAALLCEGQGDTAVIGVVARRARLSLVEANVVVADCGGRENLPDYIRFCTKLGIPHLAVMDGDVSKAAQLEVANHLQAVREAIDGSDGLGTLFEFKEDLEHAVGLRGKCGWFQLMKAAETISLESGEVAHLSRGLSEFLAPYAPSRM